MRGITNTLKEGFERFVIKKEGCWDWSGCCSKNPGYGQFRCNGKILRAHRASWILNFGEIPSGMFVCHKCDNKRCSNPDHLFLGTCKENNLDAIHKNIHPTMGKKRDLNHKTKIFSKDIRNIIKLFQNGLSCKEISLIYSVCRETIRRVVVKPRAVSY